MPRTDTANPQRAGAERALGVVVGGAMALPRSDGAGSMRY